jgi:hypothetical protein
MARRVCAVALVWATLSLAACSDDLIQPVPAAEVAQPVGVVPPRGSTGPSYPTGPYTTLSGVVTEKTSEGTRPSAGAYVNSWVEVGGGGGFRLLVGQRQNLADDQGAFGLSVA